VFCYNSSPHSSTGFSPHFIMTGQEPKWNIDFLLSNNEPLSISVPEYTSNVVNRLERAHALVREHLSITAERSSTWYNSHVQKHTFGEGDRVRVHYPRRYKGKSPKWQSFYKTEGVVTKRLNDVTYVVQSASWKKSKVVHVDKLKLIRDFE